VRRVKKVLAGQVLPELRPVGKNKMKDVFPAKYDCHNPLSKEEQEAQAARMLCRVENMMSAAHDEGCKLSDDMLAITYYRQLTSERSQAKPAAGVDIKKSKGLW
jgi:hypothetical protein